MRYVYGDDLISQSRQIEDTSGATLGMVTQRRYYHYDGQMSTRQMTDESSAAEVKLEYVYDAFGIDLLEGPFPTPTFGGGFGQEVPTVNKYRYTGEQYDDDVGMYYLRARYYAHRQGRFATRDPFEGFRNDPMSLHKYLYAHGNPVMNRDPSGLFSLPDTTVSVKTWGQLAKVALFTAINGAFSGGFVGGVIAGLLALLQGKSGPQIVEAIILGGLEGALYGFLLGGIGVISATLLTVTLATLFGIQVYDSIAVLKNDKIPTSAKVWIIIFLIIGAVGSFFGARYAHSRADRVAINGAKGRYGDGISDDAVTHIIQGDGGGGHKWSLFRLFNREPRRPNWIRESIKDPDKIRGNLRLGRTKFPISWTGEKIIDAVADVITNPRSKWFHGKNGKEYLGNPVTHGPTKSGNAKRFWVEGNYDGLRIEVVHEPLGRGVITSFPIR